MGFSRQEYWSGVPLPSLNILPREANKLIFQHSFLNRGQSPEGMECYGEYLSFSGCEERKKILDMRENMGNEKLEKEMLKETWKTSGKN